MGATRRATRRKKGAKNPCKIEVQNPGSTLSHNFYNWANKEWLSTAKIAEDKVNTGVSEELEDCIFKKSLAIIKSSTNPLLHSLRESTTKESLDFLKQVLQTLQCIRDESEVHSHFAELSKRRMKSIFNFQYNPRDGTLCFDSSAPGLPDSYYDNHELMKHYVILMERLTKEFHIPFERIFHLEKNIVNHENAFSSDIKYKIRGSKLPQKFPHIPWKVWFHIIGIEGWGSMTISYSSPRWIRYIGGCIRRVPLEYWKIYLARCYIISCLTYLPNPFYTYHFDFFRKAALGQKKISDSNCVLVNLVYDYLPDLFSKIYWEKEGDPALIPEIENFSNSLKESTKHRLQITEWMKPETRKAAIEKVSYMDFQVVRPKTWNTFVEPELGTNLLKNFFALGEAATKTFISRLGKNYNSWQEGIYRVNAYYFMENNQFIIPYASCIFPFYIGGDNLGWNYGGLGGIIGHELCHGFDEDGKEYNEKGERKAWWTRSDVAAYNKKTRELVKLYSQQKMEGIHINGMRTLSENIADIGGLGIALYALKEKLRIQEFDAARVKEEYRNFFISFATSWRTKYRDTKLKRLLKIDVHSPASLRVNLVVSQFDEWYYAFDIEKGSDYVKPEDRIRIF